MEGLAKCVPSARPCPEGESESMYSGVEILNLGFEIRAVELHGLGFSRCRVFGHQGLRVMLGSHY